MACITYQELKLAPYSFERIESLVIKQNMNEHTTLYVKGIVSETTKENYLFSESHQIPVEVFWGTEKDKKIIFAGLTIGMKVKAVDHIFVVEIEAESYDTIMDFHKQHRSFQNIEKTTHTFIKEIMSGYPHAKYKIHIPDEPMGQFVLEYEETDWGLLKRICSWYHMPLVAVDGYQSVGIHFGLPERQRLLQHQIISYGVTKDLKRYQYIKANTDFQVYEVDFITYYLETTELFHIGDRIYWQGNHFYVEGVTRKLEEANLKNWYTLRLRNGLQVPKIYPEHLMGLSVKGNVVKVLRDYVKIQLEIDQPLELSKAYWFPYATIAASERGAGWYCMPESGEEVRVYLPGKDDKEAYAISAIGAYEPEQPSIEDRMSNPQTKSLKSAHNQEIKMTDTGILMSSNGNSALVDLNRSGEIQIVGQASVHVSCVGNLNIKANKKLNILAGEEIKLQCDTGGHMMMVENEIKINGNKIQHNG